MSSILVAYFSQPDPARPQGDADAGQPATGLLVDRNLVGNVQYMAQAIAYETGADLFRIKAKKLYPASYAMTVAIAQGQKQANERPELDETIEDFDKYDTVFLGYPIWWMDLPMPVYSFLESYDFSGKTIIPFLSHGGYGPADTLASIEKAAPGAAVEKDVLALAGGREMNSARQAVSNWLRELRQIRQARSAQA